MAVAPSGISTKANEQALSFEYLPIDRPGASTAFDAIIAPSSRRHRPLTRPPGLTVAKSPRTESWPIEQ